MWGNPWPPEIDIFEFYGRETGKDIVNQHINLNNDNKQSVGSWNVNIDKYKNVKNNFHEFVLEWKKDKIEIFTDGIKIFQLTNKKILDGFKTEMWIVINHGIQSEIGFKNNDYKSSFIIDYIRAYKKLQ